MIADSKLIRVVSLITGLVAMPAVAQNSPTNNFPAIHLPVTAQIFVIQDSQATKDFEPRADRVQAMVDCALTNLAAKATVADAWQSLVSTQDVIGIKVF